MNINEVTYTTHCGNELYLRLYLKISDARTVCQKSMNEYKRGDLQLTTNYISEDK